MKVLYLHLLVYFLSIIACGSGMAYFSAICIWYDVKSADKCLEKCNSDSKCNFWDFGYGTCCGRSHSKGGAQPAKDYAFGPKNCKQLGKLTLSDIFMTLFFLH